MITKIRQCYQLATAIQAQLKCALAACDKGEFQEARKYLKLTENDVENLRREVRKGA